MVQKKKEGKNRRNMEKRERKEKKYTVYRERGKREREREKENVSHLVNLGEEYMRVHFTTLSTFLKV